MFVFRLSRKPSGPKLLKLKSDPNLSKLCLLVCCPQSWSVISLCWALNLGSPSWEQLSVYEPSEGPSAFRWESQGCEEHSLSGCSLNTRLFAFCSKLLSTEVNCLIMFTCSEHHGQENLIKRLVACIPHKSQGCLSAAEQTQGLSLSLSTMA